MLSNAQSIPAVKCGDKEEGMSLFRNYISHSYLNALHFSILRVISGCENRLVVFLVCLPSTSRLVRGANAIWFVDAEHLLEALLEVVGEEAVEDRVGAGVDVGEDDQEEVDCSGGFVLRDDVNQVDNVGSEEGQPAQHKHQHDDHHHARHLALRLTPLSQACTHTC